MLQEYLILILIIMCMCPPYPHPRFLRPCMLQRSVFEIWLRDKHDRRKTLYINILYSKYVFKWEALGPSGSSVLLSLANKDNQRTCCRHGLPRHFNGFNGWTSNTIWLFCNFVVLNELNVTVLDTSKLNVGTTFHMRGVGKYVE